MAFDLGVVQNAANGMLQNMKPVDPLDRLQKLEALKTMQIQQQDIQSQVAERNAIAQQRTAATQKALQAGRIIHDHVAGGGDLDDPELLQKLYAVDSTMGDAYAKNRAEISNYQSEKAAREAAAKTAADALKETANKNAWEKLKAENEQKDKQDAIDRKNAEEAAGTLIPGSEFTMPDQNGKPQRAAQFRIRQPDGTYKNETRALGLEVAPPQNPPQPQAPASAERFQQEKTLKQMEIDAQAAKAAKENALPPLQYLKETSSTGIPYIDASKVEPKTLNALQTAAGQEGTKVVDKDTAQGLRDIATAKANQQSMMDLLNGRLAENPLSRIFVAPENKLKKIGQLDPNLAVTGTFVGPAIQSLRAVAGAKQFRITQAEINNAIANFVPQASDTVDVAKAKMTALAHFMDNKERAALGGGGNSDPLGIR